MIETASDATLVALDVIPRLARLVTRVLDTEVDHDITLRQYRILTRLQSGGHEAISALADRSGVRRPTMSQTVDGLVERGWVTRTEDADDRRRRSVTITAAGQSVVSESARALRGWLDDVLDDISDDERTALFEGLAAVERVLDARWAQLLEQPDE